MDRTRLDPTGRAHTDGPPTFGGLLVFERDVFGDPLPIPSYDPYLIRYGEYRFVLDELGARRGDRVLDVGCEWNVLSIYLACRGVDVLAIDIDPDAWIELEQRKRRAESITGRRLPLRFAVHDATRMELEPGSVDAVVAVSSIEHMFREDSDGDTRAIDAIARVLRPGGRAVVTVPMSNGNPFHEASSGDAHFGAPYRVYDLAALETRLLSNPTLRIRRLAFLAQTTPDPRYDQFEFARFWNERLSAEDRSRWGWADAMLAEIFNPIVGSDDEIEVERLNTALIAFERT